MRSSCAPRPEDLTTVKLVDNDDALESDGGAMGSMPTKGNDVTLRILLECLAVTLALEKAW